MNSWIIPSRRRNRGLFNQLMTDPFDSFFKAPSLSLQSFAPTTMRTDIKETDEGFEVAIDLPGFKKENLQAELKDGYLTISAETTKETEEKDENENFVRKERFSGSCSRTFYVGEDVNEDDIKATIEDGVLHIGVPRKQPQPELEEKHTIAIEG